MKLAFVKFSVLLIFIVVRDVKSELDAVEVLGAAIDMITSVTNPLDFVKSVKDFATLLLSENKEDDIDSSLSAINDKLDDISINLANFEKEVSRKLENIKTLVETKPSITEFFLIGNEMDEHYKNLLRILKQEYTDDYIKRFVNGVANYEPRGITRTLIRMHSLLYKVEKIAYKYSKTISSPVCPPRYSQVETVQNFHTALHNAEVKGLAILGFALKYRHKNNATVLKGNLNVTIENFYRRSNESFLALRDTMGMIDRELWNCQPALSFDHFGPFLYKTFEVKYSIDGGPHTYCAYLKNVQSRCESTNEIICNRYEPCRGKIKDCERLSEDTTVCYASKDKTHKLDYAAGKTKVKQKPPCRGKTYRHQWKEHHYQVFGDFDQSASCLCTCENSESKTYISLREAVSDVHEHMVITGVRFIKANNIFHLQVEQAKSLPSVSFNSTTRSWKKVNTFKVTDENVRAGVDYHQLSWDLRSFELDVVTVPESSVVTGVKFFVDKGLIKLQVRGTWLNDKTGVLYTGHLQKYYWRRESKDQLNQFELKHLDLPPDNEIKEIVFTKPNQYLTLTTSDMDTDIGQNVVPFVDMNPVSSQKPDVPLSGIGLFHKSYKENAAGYLTLKLLTHNLR